MDAIETENSNDSTDKVKEKVRVVSLEDPSIIASNFAANSNSSVWSLCGLNSDDHHVDLGDISPSISPVFTEQQMADHLRDRLMADDHMFSGEHASESTLNENSKPLPDLQSDLELFDREMKSLESLDSASDRKSKMAVNSGKNEGQPVSKASSENSERKRVGDDPHSRGENGIALRTRNRRRGAPTGDVKAGMDSEKDVKSKIGKKEGERLVQRDDQKSEKADKKSENVGNQNKSVSDGGNIEKKQNTSEEKGVVSSSLTENPPKQNKENTAEIKNESMPASSSDSQPARRGLSPDKRVTRSTTGNLKPKQPFDEIQEKEELKNAKRKDASGKRGKKMKGDKDDAQSADNNKVESYESKQTKDGKLVEPKKNIADDEESVSSSDDDELDFHEDDSDYSPEDDPDRPWCICRKPHGNKFMICCDGCEEWFHGKCVGITMEEGKIMEKQGKEYVCDKCQEKKAKESQMAEKARELAETIKTKPDTTTHDSPKAPRPKRKLTPSNDVAEPDSSEKPTQGSAPSQSDDFKKRKGKEAAGFKIPKKVRTTPTPQIQTTKKCIVEGCPRTSFEGAVYCGRGCIERHVNEAVKMLSSKEHGGKLHTSEGNRVSMIEKFSGRLVAGMAAPVVTKLTEWILKNPSFQVLVSGTSPTSHSSTSLYSKVNAESKQKKDSDKKSEVETVRSNVRRMMKDILVERKKESSEIRISVEEIMKLVGKIEDDMYKAFKDTSHRYKAKYRTLMFNLRDPRNKVLYKRVLTGDIPPDKLVWMTSDELATKELAQWREQETKHMIDMIKKEEENTNKARLIKKTHKGEVDVDGDEDLSTLEATNIKEVEEKKPPAKVEEKVDVPIVDTTEEHRAHLFDLNCKICTGKMAPPGEIVAKSPNMTNAPIQAAAESSIPSPPLIQEPISYTEPLSPDGRDTPTDFLNVAEKPKESYVWKGFVMMQSVAKFGTNAFVVSGSGDNLIQILPDTLHVAGRIAHKHVWEYVKQCRNSSSRELCIIRFAAATDEEKISYVSLYSYFHSRKRCGVIGNCHAGVKDMYLVPLASHEPIPSPLLPFNGPGLQEPRPHMLLGVIVRNKNVPAKRSRSGSDRLSSKTEPPSKRPSTDELSSKSSTPTTQTPVKPSDSPVDEIEDIVFHYHNTQGGKPESAKPEPTKPAPSTSIPPMISALLKIQEQENRLRELKKQSEKLEKELSPKMTTAPVGAVQMAASTGIVTGQSSQSVPHSTAGHEGSVSTHFSSQVTGVASFIASQKPTQLGGKAKAPKNLGFPAVIQSKISSGGPVLSVDGPKADEDQPYDPETADNEDTPYDPEDMDTIDISLDEAPSPDKGSTALTQTSTAVAAAQNTALFKPVHQNLTGANTASLQHNALNRAGKPEIRVDSLVEQLKNHPVLAPDPNIKPHSIPKELEEKVQALLKPDQGNLVKQTNIQQFGKSEGASHFNEPNYNRGEFRPPEQAGVGAYNHSRDFPEKREFPERREFSERRGYNEGRDDPKFYSSRFSLNARHEGEERGGHDRRYQRGHDRGYDRDYRSREYRDDDRHWDDYHGGRDDRRGDEHYNRNRDRYQRDRNWRR